MMDPDFKERMFAKQMAVMKGQAWNVVETLKTPDHGPLELTRRAKVCVWDDLVDVPVAIPMRVTSEEMRKRAESEFRRAERPSSRASVGMDEMDIAGATSSPAGAKTKLPPADDLLGIATPPGDLPHPGRFEISAPMAGVPHSPSGSLFSIDQMLADHSNGASSPQRQRGDNYAREEAGPIPRSSLTRASYQKSNNTLNMYSPKRMGKQQRRYSVATHAARKSTDTIAQQLYGAYGDGDENRDDDGGDDLEGDLGYAAAEGMEGQQRKVIVERLELVKSRNPVFTWC